MQDFALQGISTEISDDDFSTGWWFEPFGLDARQVMGLLPEAAEKAQLVELLTALEKRANHPLAPAEPKGFLIAWPSGRSGLAMLLCPDGERMNLTDFWPFLTSGSEHEAEIEMVRLAPNRLQAMVEARIGDDLALCYHEVNFAVNRGLYVKGATHRLVLAGVAHSFEPANTDPIVIRPDAPGYAAMIAAGMGNEADGTIEIHTKGMAAVLPRESVAPHGYEFRGPVVQIRDYLGDVLGQRLWLVRVTVARIGEGNDTNVNLDIALTEAVLNGRPLPAVGDDVQGFILLQGTIWLPDAKPRRHD